MNLFSKKILHFLLIGLAVLANFYLWSKAGASLLNNIPLTQQVPVSILQWQVEELRSDRYALKALYDFEFNSQCYQGQTLFQPVYLNQFSAIEGLREAAQQTWIAWIDPSNPNHSSLEKSPFVNLLCRAILSAVILIYFVLIPQLRCSNHSNPI